MDRFTQGSRLGNLRASGGQQVPEGQTYVPIGNSGDLQLALQDSRSAIEQELRAKGFIPLADGNWGRPMIGPDGKPNIEIYDKSLLRERVHRVSDKMTLKPFYAVKRWRVWRDSNPRPMA